MPLRVRPGPFHSQSMATRSLSRLFLRLFLAFLVLTALVAIGAVLGGDLGDTQARILGTSATVSGASICAMACAAFRGRHRRLGDAGIGMAMVAAVAVVVALWSGSHASEVWKSVLILVLLAVATAHAELLWLPSLAAAHRWLQRLATASIGLLTLLLAVAIVTEPDSAAFVRTLIVLAILVALQTLLVPLLWKLGGAPTPIAEQLLLVRQPDGSFADAAGQRYAVQRLDGTR